VASSPSGVETGSHLPHRHICPGGAAGPYDGPSGTPCVADGTLPRRPYGFISKCRRARSATRVDARQRIACWHAWWGRQFWRLLHCRYGGFRRVTRLRMSAALCAGGTNRRTGSRRRVDYRPPVVAPDTGASFTHSPRSQRAGAQTALTSPTRQHAVGPIHRRNA